MIVVIVMIILFDLFVFLYFVGSDFEVFLYFVGFSLSNRVESLPSCLFAVKVFSRWLNYYYLPKQMLISKAMLVIFVVMKNDIFSFVCFCCSDFFFDFAFFKQRRKATALMVASTNGYKEVVERLLSAGADVNLQNTVCDI